MIVFENNNDLEPYKKLRDLYDLALSKNQMNIEAILIASFSHEDNEVDSRVCLLYTSPSPRDPG